jgi:hypothetical protein
MDETKSFQNLVDPTTKTRIVFQTRLGPPDGVTRHGQLLDLKKSSQFWESDLPISLGNVTHTSRLRWAFSVRADVRISSRSAPITVLPLPRFSETTNAPRGN